MKKLAGSNQTLLWVGGFVVVGIAIYLLSPGLQAQMNGAGFMQWRRRIILLTGTISWVLMTACMVIALRPLWLDRLMNGIDKAYGVHKWAGITVTVTLVLHWLMYEGPRWLVSWGLLTLSRRAGGGRGEATMWIQLAKKVGEWAFYAFVLMAVIALVKFFPYKLFSKAHKVFPVIYLAGAYHSVVILPENWWSTPAAYMVLALAIIGSYAAIVSLFQQVGRSRRMQATVTQVRETASGILEVCLQLAGGRNMCYQAGQFAFVDFGFKGEGHHPFTIASADQQELRFTIKPLGDFTNRLGQLLQVGQDVQIEGPYGQFNFQSDKPCQIWVAGGIGIAPFIGKLEALAARGEKVQGVDFWYCVRSISEGQYPENLSSLCEQTGVRLHRVVDEQRQWLTPEMIRQSVQDLLLASVWFCGPSGFAKALCSGLKPMGLSEADFHAEHFEMR
ncbi:TPA: ferric reductase-like transmembrane domain-containing protein [Enterobacter cloacae]|nr:ferric reductase-like transmembrane domain-containing protein [Enterobacter cloacae]